jgi:hypothetical protein
LEGLGINGIILICIINEEYKNVDTGLYWLRVQASAEFLRTWKFIFVLLNTVYLATMILKRTPLHGISGSRGPSLAYCTVPFIISPKTD